MLKKSRIYFNTMFKSILATGLLILSASNTSFAGHKNYFIKTTVDYGGFGLMSEIINDDGLGNSSDTTSSDSPYEEEKGGYSYAKVRHYGNICKNIAYTNEDTSYLQINFNGNRESTEKRISQYDDLKVASDQGLVFSFPGLKDSHNGGYKATGRDFEQAMKVSDTLITSLNQALLFIRNNSMDNIISNHSLNLALAKLSYTSELSRISSYTIKVGGKDASTQFKISNVNGKNATVQKELIPVNGLKYDDYIKITVLDGDNKGNSSYFPYRIAKGYYPGQALYEATNSVYRDNVKGNENEYLTWGQLILQAMLNYDTKGVTEQDFATDVQTIIGQGLGSDLSRTISSTRSILGLSSMSELVLNMGARPTNYHLGVMSKDMHNIALTIYTLNLIIALMFVGFMIVKMLHQKMLATTNVIAKTSLMEGIKDLAFVAVMLGFFAPLFEMLLELNFLIVRTFSYSSSFMASFTAMGSKTLSMESMAGFVVSTMFLSIDMYINFVYLVRAITVSFLFAIAPIIIVSYLWSPNQKNMVFSYFRELVGNIFMQSFHAITMTFFSAYNLNNMSSLEAIASAYCFVPITQLFRQLVIGNNGGFSEKIGGKLAGQVANMTTGMQKAGLEAKHAQEMTQAQTKANLDMQKAQTNADMVNASAGAMGAVASGAMMGAVAGPVGAVAGALIGGAIGAIGAGVAGEIARDGTRKAQTELGSVQNKQANETLGMGLAELGLGLGVSSFDSAGDRMVQSGLSSIQDGARMKGRAQAILGAGGDYIAETAKVQTKAEGYIRTIDSAGRMAGKGFSNSNNISSEQPQTNGTRLNMGVAGSLDVNDIKTITNKNEVTGSFDFVSKFTESDLALKHPKLYSAYEDYQARHIKPDVWANTSKETGIEKFFTDNKGFIGGRMDSSKTGYSGFETVQQFNEISGKIENMISSLKFDKS